MEGSDHAQPTLEWDVMPLLFFKLLYLFIQFCILDDTILGYPTATLSLFLTCCFQADAGMSEAYFPVSLLAMKQKEVWYVWGKAFAFLTREIDTVVLLFPSSFHLESGILELLWPLVTMSDKHGIKKSTS